MYSLRSVDILSCAKMMAAIHGCISIVLIPLFLVAGVAPFLVQSPNSFSGLTGIVLFLLIAIILPFVYAGMGFLLGALVAWVYSLVAGKMGGIKFAIEPTAATLPAAPAVS